MRGTHNLCLNILLYYRSLLVYVAENVGFSLIHPIARTKDGVSYEVACSTDLDYEVTRLNNLSQVLLSI